MTKAVAAITNSVAYINIIENMNETVRCVGRNLKLWHDPAMELRWTGAVLREVAEGFQRIESHRQLTS